FFSSRRRHTRSKRDWSSDVCSSDLHFASTAKRVIFLYMSGGPSHLELFDHKPTLARLHLQPMPESFTRGQPIAQLQNAELKCFEIGRASCRERVELWEAARVGK